MVDGELGRATSCEVVRPRSCGCSRLRPLLMVGSSSEEDELELEGNDDGEDLQLEQNQNADSGDDELELEANDDDDGLALEANDDDELETPSAE